MYTDIKIDIVNKEIKEVDTRMHENDREQKIVEQCDSELLSLVSLHNEIILEVSETWQEGEMFQLLENTDYELRESVNRLFHDIEDEKSILQKEKYNLEEMQEELYDRRNQAMEDDTYEC